MLDSNSIRLAQLTHLQSLQILRLSGLPGGGGGGGRALDRRPKDTSRGLIRLRYCDCHLAWEYLSILWYDRGSLCSSV